MAADHMTQEAEDDGQKPPCKRVCLAMYALFAAFLNGSAGRNYARIEQAPSADTDLKLYVLICDFAAVPVKTLSQAQRRTRAIFQAAGVKTVWVEDFQPGGFSNGPEPLASQPAPDIVLKILTSSMGNQLGFRREKLGFALQCTSDKGACYASVFYQRVEKLAGQAAAPLPMVLACAFAHEIGHLLLGADSHSEHSIMRADWDAVDFSSNDLRNLLFTPGQAKLIRASVRALGRNRALPKEARGG
jgi:hypothetical protein